MKSLFNRFVREEEGQDLTEYGLLVAFIAFLVIIGVTAFGGALDAFYDRLTAEVATWNPA